MIQTQSEVPSAATTALASRHGRALRTQREDGILKLHPPSPAHLRYPTCQLHPKASRPVQIISMIASDSTPAHERLIQILSDERVSVLGGVRSQDRTHYGLGHECAPIKSTGYIQRGAEIILP